MLLWWVIGGTLLYYSQAAGVDSLYPTQADLDRAAVSEAANTAFVAMAGPARALNTVGGQVTWQASAFGAILAGLMSMFLVGRHTRAEEESGRDELVRSAPVGRHATFLATLILAFIANAVLGAAIAASLVADGLAAAGSAALGLGATLCGLAFAGVAFVAAQLTQSTRAMYGIVGAAIGVSYVLRAIGDVGAGGLSWLSPIGWYQAIHAFSGERWGPALLLVALAILSTTVAVRIFNRRDFGAGVLANRPGPAVGSPGLTGRFGLTWRLHRSALTGWAVGLFLGGLAYGSIGSDVRSVVGDSGYSKDLFAQSGPVVVDSFYATAALMLALIASGYTVSAALIPRSEEDAGRLEPLLSTDLGRIRWALEHAVVVALGTVLMAILTGFGMGLSYALVAHDAGAIWRYTAATAQFGAPMLLLAATTWLGYGLRPAWAGLAWLWLAFCAVVLLFGATLHLPSWALDLSPFRHLAAIPAEPFRAGPFVLVLAGALLTSFVALLALRRRDVR
jgi:ABC-2 type transport system permease protein